MYLRVHGFRKFQEFKVFSGRFWVQALRVFGFLRFLVLVMFLLHVFKYKVFCVSCLDGFLAGFCVSSFPRGFRVQVAAFLGIWVFKCLGFLVGRKKLNELFVAA